MITRIIIALLLAASVAKADDNPLTLANTLEEGKPPFREELREAARISGSVLVGVQAIPQNGANGMFEAFIPKTWRGYDICARVVSVDGLYEAENTYSVSPGWTGGTVEIPYPTQYTERLMEADPYGLAIRLSHGACTGNPGTQATVAFRDAVAAEPLTVLVNSFRADMVILYVDGDSATPIVCEPVDLPGRTAFDTFCEIDSLQTGPEMTLEIVRVKNRSATSDQSVSIMLPRS